MCSTLEKVKIVEFYEATNSVMATQEKFCQQYEVVVCLHPRLLKVLLLNLELKARLSINKKGAYGKPKESRAVENIATVMLSVIEDPNQRYRKCAEVLNMKPMSLLTILKILN